MMPPPRRLLRVAATFGAVVWIAAPAPGAKPLPPLPEPEEVGAGLQPGGSSMTLDEALERAIQVSPDLKAAELEVRIMAGRLFGVRLSYYPEFEVRAELPRASEYRVERDDRPQPIAIVRSHEPAVSVVYSQLLPTNTSFEASYEHAADDRLGLVEDRVELEFAQELVRKDPVWRSMNLAEKRVWLEEQTRDSIRRSFLYEVKAAYLSHLEAQSRLANAGTRYTTDKDFAEESERKYEAGIIAEYNVLDYRRDFELSKERMAVRKAASERARNLLLYLLQVPFDDPVVFRDVPDPVIDPVLCDGRRMLDSGLHVQTAIAQLRYALFSNEENLSFLRNSLLPSVKLRAGLYYESSLDDIDPIPAIETREMSVGLLISMPLFGDQFQKGNNINLEKLDREINEITIRDEFHELARTVRDDLVTVAELRSRHEIAKRRFAISTRDFELAKLRFEVGNVGSWDMIRSKNEYFGVIDDLLALRFALLRKLAEIERDYPLPPAPGGRAEGGAVAG